MSKLIIKLLIILLLQFALIQGTFARDMDITRSFYVEIPKIVRVEGTGMALNTQTHGIPSPEGASFSFLVDGSIIDGTWELTTSKPIAISVSYNTSGYILANFTSLTRDDGYTILPENIRMYPNRADFDGETEGGDKEKIFHFQPIVKVSKTTPPGQYFARITFTVMNDE